MVEKHVQQGNSFWNLHTQLFDEHKQKFYTFVYIMCLPTAISDNFIHHCE